MCAWSRNSNDLHGFLINNSRKDEKYLIVFCDVRRKDVEKFIHAIEEKNQGFMLLDI